MNMPQLIALQDHWKQFPPLHVIRAHELGIAKPAQKAKSMQDFVADFKSQIGGGAVIKTGG